MNASEAMDVLAQCVNDELTDAHNARLLARQSKIVAGNNLRKMHEYERDLILLAVAQCDGDRVRAAAVLGIGKTTLYRKLKEYKVQA